MQHQFQTYDIPPNDCRRASALEDFDSESSLSPNPRKFMALFSDTEDESSSWLLLGSLLLHLIGAASTGRFEIENGRGLCENKRWAALPFINETLIVMIIKVIIKNRDDFFI